MATIPTLGAVVLRTGFDRIIFDRIMKTGFLNFFKMILPFMILPILRMGPGICSDWLSRIPCGQCVPSETVGTRVDGLAATGDCRYVSLENGEEDE